MPEKYAVRQVRLTSGERLPVLVERTSGVPMFDPTIFAVTQVRSRNRAAATIDQALRAISILYLFIDAHNIDFGARFCEGRVLENSEVDALVRYCRLPLSVLNCDRHNRLTAPPKTSRKKVISFENARARRQAPVAEVQPQSAGIRIRYVRNYLDWLTRNSLLKLRHDDSVYIALKSNADTVISSINARIPSNSGRNVHGKREGLAPEALIRLLEVINPTSPDNPWKSAHARERNSLAVQWLLTLGLRRGELLGIRISDINFQKNQVFIARRADDPDDPRKVQPLVKTSDRIIPLDENLIVQTRRYIIGIRRILTGARKHDFLFVANGTGAPLSMDALNKSFKTLREKCPDLPDNLTPHVLRHDWNDRFSIMIDDAKVSEEQEKRTRSYLMGWSPTSATALTYTRRHIREKAKRVSLEMQEHLLRGNNNEK